MIDLTVNFSDGFAARPTTENVQAMDSIALHALKKVWIARAEDNGVLSYLRKIGQLFGAPFRPAYTKGSITDDYARRFEFEQDIILEVFETTGNYIPHKKTIEQRVKIVVRYDTLLVCRYYFHNPSHPECIFVPGDWICIVQAMKSSLASKLNIEAEQSEENIKATLVKELLLDV